MIALPIGRQAFDFDCGAKALQVVFRYYGIDVREDTMVKELGSDKNGTSVKNMVAMAEKYGFHVVTRCGTSLRTAKHYIDDGYPVIVLLQAWAERPMTLKDWREDDDDGHYAILIGYRNNIFVFEDPSSIRRTWLRKSEFLARWHDVDPRTGERYDRFSIVLKGKQPAQSKIEHMD
ncbi:MAG: cysteine peptidase family C39 domain-containing protein [Chloroflexota bacterium]